MAPDPEPAAQAYFHKVAQLKGVYGIALNRPKSKNAISVQLLEVGAPPSPRQARLTSTL